ncbi:MAG: hypothetical protein HGB22_06945 [Chlorobiaceae bacterium]|nr:hypothetical protein [Chlorobiaceae bacterium]
MKKNTGLWIDHKEAIMVVIKDGQATIQHVESGADGHFKATGGWKSGGTAVAQSISSEGKAEEIRKHQFHAFYKEVMHRLEDSTEIAVFGPGEAKTELGNEIKKNKQLQNKVSVIEACDRLTENQLVAKVKAFFLK